MPPRDERRRDAIDRSLRDRFGWLPYRILGGAALFGCAVVLACDLIMWTLIDGYSPISQTISELAAGPHYWLQDSGIVAFVFGILALTAGLVLRGEAGALPWAVRGGFALLAVDIALIALWNEYGDGEPGGIEIHRYCVAVLYGLVGFLLWFGSSVPPVRSHGLSKVGKGAAVAWLIAGPLFYVVPDWMDGAYERGLAIILVGSVAIAGWQLFERPGDE